MTSSARLPSAPAPGSGAAPPTHAAQAAPGTSPAPGTPTPPPLRRHAAGRGTLGGVGLVLGGTVSVQFGSACAALLFPRAGALGTVGLRVAFAAVLLLVVARPRLRGHSAADWRVA